ncbi:MAG TPA: hypothetical protein RMI62_18580 [Polyangiaceae bacterium LLY-WYZ-15_(1-7)]|nr:hypothetical protein [Polyangiaceae bacterium LLY-WYZ-15_(1-7)]
MTLRLSRLLMLVVLSGAVAGFAAVASAQDPAGREEAAPPSSGDGGDDEEVVDDAEADVVEEGDTKVKVFRFSGLDISGRLKSPQLLYFLNRLRAEFDRPKLPHRSFMPELVRSTKAKGM